MSEEGRIGRIERRVAWCLPLLVLLGITQVGMIAALVGLYATRDEVDPWVGEPSATGQQAVPVGDGLDVRDFDDPDTVIRAASGIAIAENFEKDGRIHSRIREFLWRQPGVRIHYDVGDEIGSPSERRPNTSYGELQIVFFRGDPAGFTEASSVHQGRIPAYGDMKLTTFISRVEELLQKRGSEPSEARGGLGQSERQETGDSGVMKVVDPEEMIRSASALLLAEYREKDGMLHSVVSEVLWKEPGVELTYGVGDEFGAALPREDGVVYGEGQIIVCRGSEAFPGQALAIHGGRIGLLADLKVSEFRRMVREIRIKD